MLNAHDHTSVLHGSGESIVPKIPQLVNVADYNRSEIGWDTSLNLNGTFTGPFPFVWALSLQTTSSVLTVMPVNDDNNKHVCDVCDNKKFTTLKSLKTPINHKFHKVKQLSVIDMKSLPEQLSCNFCKNHFFCSLDTLSNHMSKMHRIKFDLICSACDRGPFKSKRVLNLHTIKVHNQWSKLNNDETCETDFPNTTNLCGDNQDRHNVETTDDVILTVKTTQKNKNEARISASESVADINLSIENVNIASTVLQSKSKSKQMKQNCMVCNKVLQSKCALLMHNRKLYLCITEKCIVI